MLQFPFITLDTLFQHPEDSHRPLNSDHREEPEEENIPLSELGQCNHDSDYKEDSEDEDIPISQLTQCKQTNRFAVNSDDFSKDIPLF